MPGHSENKDFAQPQPESAVFRNPTGLPVQGPQEPQFSFCLLTLTPPVVSGRSSLPSLTSK